MNLKQGIIIICLLLVLPLYGQSLSDYNPIWNTPSKGSHESMPCGGGSIGMNVWVENGELYFYFSRSGTFDANNGFLKGGRVKIHLTPNPFESGDFRQELKLEDGYIEITAGKEKNIIEIWADVFHPVIHVDVKGSRKTDIEVSYESWRYKNRLLRKDESHFNSYKGNPPEGLFTAKDSIGFIDNQIGFCHRNAAETVFDRTVERQGLNDVKDQMMNPLKHLTFGGRIYGDNLVAGKTYTGIYTDTDFKGWSLKSRKPAQEHQIRLALATLQCENPADWETMLNKTISKVQTDKKAKQKTRQWWNSYWKRSYVFIDSGK